MINHTKKLLLLACSGLLAFSLLSENPASSQSAEYATRVELARQVELTHLVRQDCGSCHGMTLKGGLGKSLLPVDLKDRTLTELVNVILDGMPGTPMPGWRGLLSQEDAIWIARHLKNGTIKRGNLE